MTSQCLISFGSNLGDRDRLIAEAAQQIASSGVTAELRTSRLFETPPIGGPHGQEPFLNAVAAFDTEASAREILELLQQVEQQLGRQRRRRWDARSIDLDVVLHGELVGGGTGLIVPHPRYTAREFVLEPACDVAPHYRDPRFGWTLQQLARHLRHGVPSLALVGGSAATRAEICRRLTQEHHIRTFLAAPVAKSMPIIARAPASVPHSTTANLPTTSHQSGPHKSGPHTREATGDLSAVGPPLSRHRPEASSSSCGERLPPSESKWDSLGDAMDFDSQTKAPWVSAFVPPLPAVDSPLAGASHVPRLIARIQSTTAATRWPAPHQMWPAGWRWPEYRLEIDDLDWAVSEIVSALDSMRCPVRPITADGHWWS